MYVPGTPPTCTHMHQTTPTDRRLPHVYHLTQSCKDGQKEKLILSFSQDNPRISVEPLDGVDPSSPNFTTFRVLSSVTGHTLVTLRAPDIVQQRTFMAALGGTGPGLYTPKYVPLDLLSSGISEDQSQRNHSYNSGSACAQDIVQVLTYKEVMRRLPAEFYFPKLESMSVDMPGHSPPPVCIHSHTCRVKPSSWGKLIRDNFLPPRGPKIHNHLMVIGYGSEVGLASTQVALWNPERKFYFFLDHKQQSVFVKDPRSMQCSLNVTETSINRNEPVVIPANSIAMSDTFVLRPHKAGISIKSATKKASERPHALILAASGGHGSRGKGGKGGTAGQNGPTSTSSSEPPQDGLAGTGGGDGENGTGGGNGSDVVIDIVGSSAKVEISGSCTATVRLGGNKREDVVFVDCRGGDGGGGGSGGDGGRGGRGADGACDGDEGGHGGDGGDGGRGGRGGGGGSAGNGGNCVVRTEDARLLMLVEVDCAAGKSGVGGRGGRGGSRGSGGYGGTGKSPLTISSPSATDVDDSRVSRPGKPGMSGRDGSDRAGGRNGVPGKDGSLLWVVRVAASEKVLQVSESRYNAAVISLSVSPDTGDGVYRPNGSITVSEVTVSNTGGLTLPAGATLSIPSSDTVRFQPTVFQLPEIAPGKLYTVPVSFHGRIFDKAPPNFPGAFVGSAQFSPCIKLLGRPFDIHMTQTLTVRYPLQLSLALSKKSVSQGEITILEVGVENVSSCSYGSASGRSSPMHGCNASLQLCLDGVIIPIDSTKAHEARQEDSITPTIYSYSMESSTPYDVTYDLTRPNTLHVSFLPIGPGENFIVPIKVQLDDNASLGDICPWQVELYLGGKLVEYMQSEITVVPDYSPQQTYPVQLGDTLMVFSKEMAPEELENWNVVFDQIGLTVDYWDTQSLAEVGSEGEGVKDGSAYKLLPPFSKLYKDKLILFPDIDLDKLPSTAITSHFCGDNDPLHSSMAIFLSSSPDSDFQAYFQQQRCATRLLKRLCLSERPLPLPKRALSGCHLLQPGTVSSSEAPVRHCERKSARKLELTDQSHAVFVVNRKRTMRRVGTVKYNYGSVDLRRCPLQRACNFQCVDNTGGRLADVASDDPHWWPSSKMVPLASNFGQVLVATLSAVPLPTKLSLLRANARDHLSGNAKSFHLPNGASLTQAQLVAVCIASDVADEVFLPPSSSNKKSSPNHVRMDMLARDLHAHGDRYTQAPGLVSQLLDLVEREARERRSVLSAPLVRQSTKDICKWCVELSHTFKLESPVPPSALPRLLLLQDSMRVLRPHQLTTSDFYDITTNQ